MWLHFELMSEPFSFLILSFVYLKDSVQYNVDIVVLENKPTIFIILVLWQYISLISFSMFSSLRSCIQYENRNGKIEKRNQC